MRSDQSKACRPRPDPVYYNTIKEKHTCYWCGPAAAASPQAAPAAAPTPSACAQRGTAMPTGWCWPCHRPLQDWTGYYVSHHTNLPAPLHCPPLPLLQATGCYWVAARRAGGKPLARLQLLLLPVLAPPLAISRSSDLSSHCKTASCCCLLPQQTAPRCLAPLGTGPLCGFAHGQLGTHARWRGSAALTCQQCLRLLWMQRRQMLLILRACARVLCCCAALCWLAPHGHLQDWLRLGCACRSRQALVYPAGSLQTSCSW